MWKYNAWARGVFGFQDTQTAWNREQAAVQSAIAPRIPPALLADMQRIRPRDACLLGYAAADPAIPVHLERSETAGTGHTLVVGGSGAGKTRETLAVERRVIESNVQDPSSIGMWVEDHKTEVVPLTRDLIGEMYDTLPRPQGNALIDRLVVINPFSTEALVPFNVLAPEPGIPPEAQAFEVATLVDRMGGADIGFKQDDCLYHLLLLGIVHEPEPLTLVEVAALLEDLNALMDVARRSPSPAVRDYFAGFSGKLRIPLASLEGLRARLRRLLRLPATRLMLGSKERLSFRRLLAWYIVLVDLGSPPLGCEDIGRFYSRTLGVSKHCINASGHHAAIDLPSVTRLDSKFPE